MDSMCLSQTYPLLSPHPVDSPNNPAVCCYWEGSDVSELQVDTVGGGREDVPSQNPAYMMSETVCMCVCVIHQPTLLWNRLRVLWYWAPVCLSISLSDYFQHNNCHTYCYTEDMCVPACVYASQKWLIKVSDFRINWCCVEVTFLWLQLWCNLWVGFLWSCFGMNLMLNQVSSWLHVA